MLVESHLNNPVFLSTLAADWPGANFWTHWVFYTVVIITVVLLFVMGFIYLERRLLARMQSRLGPNRTGPLGLFQPVADASRSSSKRTLFPARPTNWSIG